MRAWRLNGATESCKTLDEKKLDFMRFAGVLSHEDAEEMASFVDHADFSKVDEGAWNSNADYVSECAG